MLNRIGTGQIGNAFSRLFGMDDLNAVGTLAPEVLPTTSIWERPEFWALIGGGLCGIRQTVSAGGAGNAGFVRVYPPSASSLMTIMERVIIETAGVFKWGLLADPGVVNGAGAYRDTRKIVANSFATGVGSKVQIGTGVAGSLMTIELGGVVGPIICPIEVIVRPGHCFHIEGPVNTAIALTTEWRERLLSPAESGLL